jgi:hypothetical protein
VVPHLIYRNGDAVRDLGGRSRSGPRRNASRENGKLGGRPRKSVFSKDEEFGANAEGKDRGIQAEESAPSARNGREESSLQIARAASPNSASLRRNRAADRDRAIRFRIAFVGDIVAGVLPSGGERAKRTSIGCSAKFASGRY